MRSLSHLILISILSLTQSACTPEAGFGKTPLSPRYPTHFSNLGVSIDLPQNATRDRDKYLLKVYDSNEYQQNTRSKGAIIIMMYPLWPGVPAAEPRYALVIRVQRIPTGAFEDLVQGSHFVNWGRCFEDGDVNVSDRVTQKVVKRGGESDEYLCFCKIQDMRDGGFLIASAQLLNNTNAISVTQEDLNDIEAIVESVSEISADY